jgi:glycosidase
MKLSFAMLATMRGIPQMFYGDELMFNIDNQNRDDGRLRKDFPGGWEGDAMNLFEPSGREAAASDPEWAGAADLHAYVKTLLNWRKDKEVIHSGKTMHFIPQDNTYAYFRYNDTDLVFVFINNSDKEVKLTWSRFAEINSGLAEGRDVLTGDAVTLSDDTVVPANTALVVEYTR